MIASLKFAIICLFLLPAASYILYRLWRSVKYRSWNYIFNKIIDNPRFQICGELCYHALVPSPVVSLTYDDGPLPPYTDQLLDTLKEFAVRATFFLVGENIERYPDLARRIVAEGHQIGNHSYSHPQLTGKSLEFIRSEIDRTDALIRSLGYQGEIVFRAPFARKFLGLPWVLKRKKKRHITFEAFPNPRDWWGACSEDVAKDIIETVSPGRFIVLHDGNPRAGVQVAKTTRLVIQGLRSIGYEFSRVDQLIPEKIQESRIENSPTVISASGQRELQRYIESIDSRSLRSSEAIADHSKDPSQWQLKRRATALRWDTIRLEIGEALPNCLLFGPSLRDRIAGSRGLLLTEDCQRILLPESFSYVDLCSVLSVHGFKRIGYPRGAWDRFNKLPEVAIFQRHDFYLSVSYSLPVLFTKRWSLKEDFSSSNTVPVGEKHCSTVRLETEYVFRALQLYDRIVFGLSEQDAIVQLYSLLSSRSSSFNWDKFAAELVRAELYSLFSRVMRLVLKRINCEAEFPDVCYAFGSEKQLDIVMPRSMKAQVDLFTQHARLGEAYRIERIIRAAPIDFSVEILSAGSELVDET